MKKLYALTIPMLLLLTTMLVGCSSSIMFADASSNDIQNETIRSALDAQTHAEESEPTSLENQLGQTLTVTTPCPYILLRYGSLTIEDSAFIAKVWNALRFDDWAEIEWDGLTWESSTELLFYTNDWNDENYHIRIAPTEVRVMKPLEVVGYYEIITCYEIPIGAYEALTALLSDYTTRNFMYELTPQIMNDLMYSSEDIYFIRYLVTDYSVLNSSVEYFLDEWDIDNWEEFIMPDGISRVMNERVIRITNRNPNTGISITIHLDYLDLVITYRWGEAWYKISQDTADTIERQFNAFRELAVE
jgi:hypothetical protein